MSAGLMAQAAAQTPSADQIEMFRNLPADQQQSILDSLNRGGQSSSSAPSSGVRSDRRLEFPDTVKPRREQGEDLEIGPDGRPLPRRLKGGDTVLLTLEIRQFKRPAPEIEERERRERQQAVMQPAVPGRVPLPNAPPEQRQSDPGADEQAPDMLERTIEETSRLEEFRERILRKNPYILDRWGILNIPDLGPIPMGGLTADEATQRLSAELRLSDFIVTVAHLPLKPLRAQSLKPFGYDLFAGITSTFAPATDVPVPAEYVVGPGDTIQVQLIGSTRGRYSLVVGRDGRINFPELGPISVSGQRFEEVREDLETRVREQMIGTQASISMGELRSIRVFVLGEVETPGSYTVSGLSTITNALFVSGGVKPIGSLRNVQLKRAGRTVVTLDLYDLLLKGDTSADTRLLPGDVIFIPPVGATVGLAGEVRRPAIYELKNETTAGQLLQLGGGLLPRADPAIATIDRVNAQRQRVTVDANLVSEQGRGMRLERVSGKILPAKD
jgi:protein involved in polysaccharide export with SLBB domain